MVISTGFIQKTYYDFLGVQEDASYEQIRAAYRSAILDCHPDKITKVSESSTSEPNSRKMFIDIQAAWETLGDSKTRSTYDSELQTLRLKSATSEDVKLEDLSVEEDDDSFVFYYDCRCGDYFTIDSADFTEIGFSFSRNGGTFTLHTQESVSLPAVVVLPCGSCSLNIRVIIDTSVMFNIDYHL